MPPVRTRTPLAAVIVAAVLALCGAPAPASAQTVAATPAYSATAPTKGALMSDGVQGRYLLGGTWLERPDAANAGLAAGWWRGAGGTAGWTPVTVPNSYNVGDYSNASMAGYVAWYRRDFTVPAHAFDRYVAGASRYWVIEFESVNDTATVWLNGHELGSHTGAYLPFEFVMRWLRSGVNQLVVRVDDTRTATSFPHANANWWNYGGILDAVYLVPVQEAEIAQVLIRPTLSCPACAANVTMQATVRNGTARPQTVVVTGTYGAQQVTLGTATLTPGGSATLTAYVPVAHPKLWAPGTPSLYRATVRVSDIAGRYLDGYTYLSGIRTVTVSGGVILLNGRRLSARGVNIHEQDLSTGEALTLAQMRQIISWVQQLHATLVRAHYPLTPELEQMADQAGIMLWSEIPVYQTPETYLAQAGYRAQAVALLRTDIADNESHPSILLWSIGNELPTPAPSGERAYIAQAAAAAHAADPTRPVGMAVSDWPGAGCQPAYAPLDVIGINEYFGWFGAGAGSTDDVQALGPFLDSVRACYPRQALMITEFGFDGNRTGPADAYGTYAFQDAMVATSLATMQAKAWLSGILYFDLRDFAARPGWDGGNPLGTPPFVTNGLVDFDGNEKSAFGIVASAYAAATQIAPARARRIAPARARARASSYRSRS